MKASSAVLILLFLSSLTADDTLDKARQIEKSGDVSGARAALAAAVQRSPGDVDALTGYAEFLVRYGDPDARGVYTKAFEAIEKSGDRDKLANVARELTILDLIREIAPPPWCIWRPITTRVARIGPVRRHGKPRKPGMNPRR